MKKLFAMGFIVAVSIATIGCTPDSPRDFESCESVEELELETDVDINEFVKTHGIYTKPATVIGVHNGSVTFEDFEGWTWGFSDDSGKYSNGDFVAMLMYDNGTCDTIFDDVILDAVK